MNNKHSISPPHTPSQSGDSFRFTREERLRRKKIIELLFHKKTSSFVQYPVKVVYRPLHEEEKELQNESVSVLFSVSKRYFKSAVRRNRIKRQLREAYRLQNRGLKLFCRERGIRLSVALIWITNEQEESGRVHYKMKKILCRLQTELSDKFPETTP